MRTHVHSTCTHTGTRTLKLTLKHTYTHVHTHMHTHMHTHTHVCVQGVARRLAGAQTSRARYPARIIPALLPQPAEPGGEWLTSSFVFCRSCGSPFALCFVAPVAHHLFCVFSLLWLTICSVFCCSCGSPFVLCFVAPVVHHVFVFFSLLWLTICSVFCRSCGSPFLLCFSLLWRTICFVFCRYCGSPSVLCPVCFAAPGFDTCHTNDSAVKCRHIVICTYLLLSDIFILWPL